MMFKELERPFPSIAVELDHGEGGELLGRRRAQWRSGWSRNPALMPVVEEEILEMGVDHRHFVVPKVVRILNGLMEVIDVNLSVP